MDKFSDPCQLDFVEHRDHDNTRMYFTDGSRYDIPTYLWEALVQTDMEMFR